MKRGDSTTGAIIFAVLIIAAIILVVWYVQSVRPTKHVIDSTEFDLAQLDQHIENACSFEEYRATLPLETTLVMLIMNETAVCMISEVYQACIQAACPVNASTIEISEERGIVSITRDGGPIVIALD